MDNLKDKLTHVADIFSTFAVLRTDSKRKEECVMTDSI
jgi:hypothetical protein